MTYWQRDFWSRLTLPDVPISTHTHIAASHTNFYQITSVKTQPREKTDPGSPQTMYNIKMTKLIEYKTVQIADTSFYTQLRTAAAIWAKHGKNTSSLLLLLTAMQNSTRKHIHFSHSLTVCLGCHQRIICIWIKHLRMSNTTVIVVVVILFFINLYKMWK